MHEVSTRVWQMFVQTGRARGISRERLAEPLPITLAELEAPDSRMDWEVLVQLCEHFAACVGGKHQLIAAGAESVTAPATMALRAVSELFSSAVPIYRAAMTWFAPALVYNVHFGIAELGHGQVRCTIEVPPPYRSCEEFFLLAQGALLAVPRFIGQDDAKVVATLTERRAELLLTTPPPLSLWARAKRVTKVVSAARTAIDELAAQQRSLRESTLAMQRLQYDFRRVIDGLPDGVIVHRAGHIVYANPAWCSYLGLPAGSLLDRNIREFLAPDDPSYPADPWLGAGLRGEQGQLKLAREGGGWVSLETAAAQPIDFDGPATLLSGRDVTERKQEALQLAVTDRMVSAGTLAAGVAHEVNNPLSYVIANLRGIGRALQRLRPQLPIDVVEDLDAMLLDAKEGAERVSEIVSDLSAFARPDDGGVRPVDVHAVLERTLKIAANQIKHRARLYRDYKPTPPALAGDGRLAQVVLNLLVNAAQAIPEGHADAHEIRVATRDLGGRVQISIHDTGCGIPETIRGRIFDPFFTTKPLGTGTGLGLSICHGIITQLGGTLTVDSSPGVGSTFVITLPVAEGVPAAEPVAPAPPLPPASPSTRAARILIVDDEPRVASALGRALEGHDVTVVRDGRTALRMLVGPEASSFDIVFCDLMMPELSGMELHAQIRAARAGVEKKLVFMTGGAFTPAAHDFLQHVDNPCLVKPFRIDQVLALVDAIMSAPPGTVVPTPPKLRESRP